MKTREADFGIIFRHWLRANPRSSAVFEIKQTETGSIPFSCLQENQIDYLSAIRSDKGTLIRVQGVNGEPDYAYYRNAPAYVVIKYPSSFHLISIDTFLLEKARSKRKSLTEARAADISVVSVKTKKPR